MQVYHLQRPAEDTSVASGIYELMLTSHLTNSANSVEAAKVKTLLQLDWDFSGLWPIVLSLDTYKKCCFREHSDDLKASLFAIACKNNCIMAFVALEKLSRV